MAEFFDGVTLAAAVSAHTGTPADRLQFAPIRTGKHNTSYWVDTERGRLVLRLAPPDDAGFLFYERRMMRQEPTLVCNEPGRAILAGLSWRAAPAAHVEDLATERNRGGKAGRRPERHGDDQPVP